MSGNPDRNINNERLFSQLSACFKRHGILEQEGSQTVLRATEETEIKEENIKD
jgi:hypothetical protein